MNSTEATAKDAYREIPGQDGGTAPPDQAGAALETEIAARLGLVPNIFRVPDEGTAETMLGLWAFTKFAYLDNPLPPLLKERLSIHLSRFCRWRYCIARHIGFLMGCGHPAGDLAMPCYSARQVAALLRRPARVQGAELEAALSRLMAARSSGIPEPESRLEADFFAAATELFLEPDHAEAARDTLLAVLGQSNLDSLLTYLGFIRTAHYLSSARRSQHDEDVKDLLRKEHELARLIEEQQAEPQPESNEVVRQLRDEITQMREEREERLRAALKGGKLGIYDYDPRSRRGTWDETTRRLWGAADDELLTYKTFTGAVHPDDLPAVEDALDTAYDPHGEGCYAAEYRVINQQSGETRWVRAEGDTTFKDGIAVRLVGTVTDITQRREVEDALAESEERFRRMADDAPVIIWVSDGNGICTYVNKRWSELTGQSFEEGLGNGWLDAVHPDDREQTQKAFLTATSTRAAFRIDYRLRRKEGVYRWAIAAAQPRFSANQQFLGYIGSVLDITERKEFELALRAREERLAAVLRAADLGAWHWNVQADEVEVNQRYAEMLGYDHGEIEISYPTFVSLVHPQDVPRVETALRDHFEGKSDLYSVEIRMRHKDGHWVWISASGRLIERDGAGRPLIMTGVHQDISGRVAAVQALRESEERFRHLANAAPVLIWMSGTEKECTWFNRSWLDFVGRSMEEELGSGWTENVHPDDLKRCLGTYNDAFDAHEAFSMEYRLRRHDGEYRWLLDKGIPRYGANGEFTGYVGTCLDITENKQTEFALRQREERLAAVLRAADLGLWHWNIQVDKAELNRRYTEIIGYDLSEVKPTFDAFLSYVHPEDVKRVKTRIQEHFEGKTDLYSVEIRMRHKDGHWVWVAASGRVIDRDSAGRPLVMTGIHQDISERVRAVQALRESEEQFRLLADNMSQFAWMADATGWIYWYNKRWFDYTGTTLEEMQGWGWRKVHHPDHEKRVVRKIAQSFATGEAWEDTFPLRGRDGKYRWFLSRALPIRDHKGRIVRWFGTNTDITERLRAEQHRELLINELNHRVKNTLAIVQGIARQTFRENGNYHGELMRSFQNRLAALASAHNLLTRSNWQRTSLKELTIESVHSGCTQDAPVHINGPPVVLTPKQAITFAMAVHELCTNATKYGALSVCSGKVEVNWAISNSQNQRRLKLVWRERGGPLVRPPRRRGFGLRMIEQALAGELDGKANVEFRPEGLVCTIEGTLEKYGGDI